MISHSYWATLFVVYAISLNFSFLLKFPTIYFYILWPFLCNKFFGKNHNMVVKGTAVTSVIRFDSCFMLKIIIYDVWVPDKEKNNNFITNLWNRILIRIMDDVYTKVKFPMMCIYILLSLFQIKCYYWVKTLSQFLCSFTFIYLFCLKLN